MPDAYHLIVVFYTCPDCGLHRQPCEVPARGLESLGVWLDATMVRLGADHRHRSPECDPPCLVDVLIPQGTAKVGGPILQ